MSQAWVVTGPELAVSSASCPAGIPLDSPQEQTGQKTERASSRLHPQRLARCLSPPCLGGQEMWLLWKHLSFEKSQELSTGRGWGLENVPRGLCTSLPSGSWVEDLDQPFRKAMKSVLSARSCANWDRHTDASHEVTKASLQGSI